MTDIVAVLHILDGVTATVVCKKKFPEHNSTVQAYEVLTWIWDGRDGTEMEWY